MSAYIVSSKSMSVIAKSVEYYANQKYLYGDNNHIHSLISKYHNGYLTTVTYGDNTERTAEKIFSSLLEINLLSLGQRYEDIKDWSDNAESFKYDKEAPAVSIPVLIDLLDNWQYQACEGCAVETDFYKLTETLQDKLARRFVVLNRGYADTIWGIDSYEELKEIEGAYAY